MPSLLPLILENRPQGRIRPELGPVRSALADLGDPQRAAPSILIVGTNGKGSTAALLEAVLGAHGMKTGLTTSPHLVSAEERIRIDGRDIDRSDLERHLDRLARFTDLTFFEIITCAAFLAFAEARVEVAVLEAGMGGSWDATRVADSDIAGITNVGGDHAAWLGASADERARDKGAALRAARWAVRGPGLAPGLTSALEAPHAVDAAELVDVELLPSGRLQLAWDEQRVDVRAPLEGAHQIANLQLALALARCATFAGLLPALDPEAVASGLARVRWPGRLSDCQLGGRTVLVDGAHNLEGAVALANHLRRRPERFNLLFSCLDDKPVEAMAEILTPVIGEAAVVELDDRRAMPMARLAAAFPRARRAASLAAALELLPDPVLAEEGDPR
jgi:dihydrofolate synthase/folylpolyglutamate synthase